MAEMTKFLPGTLLFFALLSGLILSCGPRGGEGEGKAPAEVPAVPPPLAVLRAGENPLWFELAEDGPRLINSPGEAALVPFVPWPMARHVRGLLSGGVPGETHGAEGLVMAVNREGFLHFAPLGGGQTGGDLALYRAADVPRWGPYTLAALFPFRGQAAALLYRDDFFAESAAPLPSPRVFALDPGSPAPLSLEVPAFAAFSPAEGWDVDALRFSPDGYWYYRVVRKAAGPPEIGYYRTRDLSVKGEAVSVSGFQNAALPEPLAAAPALLRSVLEAVFALGAGGGSAGVVFPGLPGPRHFSGGPAAEGAGTGTLEIAGFYREPAAPGRPAGVRCALAVLPGGRGFFATDDGGPAGKTASGGAGKAVPAGPRPLTLPPLPSGFAYTAAALVGDTLIAAWEEQEGYSIGAAGFMVIRSADSLGVLR
jgi:hypothetical protein